MTINNSNSDNPTLDDDDLEELISSSPAPNPATTTESSSPSSSSSSAPAKMASYYQPQYPTAPSDLSKILALSSYVFMSFMLQYPRLAKLVASLLLALFLLFVVSLLNNGKEQEIGIVKYDFSNVKSQYDFDIGKIDHWCIDHSEKCKCEDPLQPTPVTKKAWIHAHKNFSHFSEADFAKDVDVVFLGQGVVEAMDGKHFGKDLSEVDEYFGHVKHMFQKRFQDPGPHNHDLFGVSMGISGDQSNNILWRLMHGELDPNFNPSYWWIVVGMEDLARYRCSEEIVIMGILRIVEEIKAFKPDATIIINGLFPMIKLRSIYEPTDIDFIDARRKGDNELNDNRALMKKDKQSKTKAKEFKQNLAKRIELRFEKIKEHNKEEEQNLINIRKAINKDKSLGKKKKKQQLREIRASIQEMKEKHSQEEQKLEAYLKDLKKDVYNPIVQKKHTFTKDNVFHRNKGGIPVWTAIDEINNQLNEFCKKTENVKFYNPATIFASKNGANLQLMTQFISPRGHPTQAGYKSWMSDIHRKLIEWKVKAKKEAEANKPAAIPGGVYYDDRTSAMDDGFFKAKENEGSEDEEIYGSEDEEEEGSEDEEEEGSEDEEEEGSEDEEEDNNVDIQYEEDDDNDADIYYVQDDFM